MITEFATYKDFKVGDIVTYKTQYFGPKRLLLFIIKDKSDGYKLHTYDTNDYVGWFEKDHIRLATPEEIEKIDLIIQTKKFNI